MLKELLDNIRLYLDGSRSLYGLEEWLISNLQRILDSGNSESIDIANDIDGCLVEIAEGTLDERALRDNLLRLVNNHDTYTLKSDVSEPSIIDTVGVSSETIMTDWQDPGPIQDYYREHRVVFA